MLTVMIGILIYKFYIQVCTSNHILHFVPYINDCLSQLAKSVKLRIGTMIPSCILNEQPELINGSS